MDSVLQSREADPEEVLFNLGFAESEAFAKIPLRFLKQPSKVNIISIIINYCQASIAFTDKKFFELLDEWLYFMCEKGIWKIRGRKIF